MNAKNLVPFSKKYIEHKQAEVSSKVNRWMMIVRMFLGSPVAE